MLTKLIPPDLDHPVWTGRMPSAFIESELKNVELLLFTVFLVAISKHLLSKFCNLWIWTRGFGWKGPRVTLLRTTWVRTIALRLICVVWKYLGLAFTEIWSWMVGHGISFLNDWIWTFCQKYNTNAMHWDAKREGQEEGDRPEEEELLIVYSEHIRC